MINKLLNMVNGEQLALWCLIAFIVGYFIYKEAPEFRKRISKRALKDQAQSTSTKTIEQRLAALEASINEVNKTLHDVTDRLGRDYNRINAMELQTRNSLEEREIIMRALLGILEGMDELGVDGATKESKREINQYLSRQSHQYQSYAALYKEEGGVQA